MSAPTGAAGRTGPGGPGGVVGEAPRLGSGSAYGRPTLRDPRPSLPPSGPEPPGSPVDAAVGEPATPAGCQYAPEVVVEGATMLVVRAEALREARHRPLPAHLSTMHVPSVVGLARRRPFRGARRVAPTHG